MDAASSSAAAPPDAAAAAHAPYPPRSQAWWLVALLFFTTCLSNIDRLVIGVLVDPIRADLHISDVQMSLLLGAAYGFFYGPCSVLLGFAADRFPRRLILACSVLLWSCATVYTGLAHSFGELFLARALVGLGEASVVPAALSALVDFFPPQYRGRPIAYYLVGASFGTGLSMVLPGQILGAHLSVTLPWVGELASWRLVFAVCGLLGPAVALMLLTVREPPRRGLPAKAAQGLGLAGNLRYISRHWSVYVPLYLGFGCFLLAIIGVTAWQAAFVMRSFHLTPKAISGVFGFAQFAAGVIGYLLGGTIIDSRIGSTWRGRTRVLAAACLVGLPCAAAALATSPVAAIVMLSTIGVASPIGIVAMNAIMQEISPAHMRGFAISVNGLTSTITSYVFGPLLISLVTERVFHSTSSVGASIAVVVAPTLLIACALFATVGRNIARSVARGSAMADTIAAAHAAPST